MKKKLILLFCALLCGTVAGYANLPLLHIKDTHTVGVHAGTGWGNSITVGLDYHYYFHRHWSFCTQLEYEWGQFAPSQFQSILLLPGVEAAVWQPCSWLYLHLNAKILVSYEYWKNPEIQDQIQAWGVGCTLGGNLEFYALPQLSFTLSAQEGWKYVFFPGQGENYFFPLFSIGIRYNIL